MSTRRFAMYVLLVSVGAATVLAIIALLSGSWSYFDEKVLATAGLVAVGSILTMVCGTCWETRRAPSLAVVGLAAGSLATLMSLAAIWLPQNFSQPYDQIMCSGWIISVACAHACLLSMARLSARFKWVQTASFIAILALATQMLYWLWNNWTMDTRLASVNAVLVAAGSLLVPLLHKLNATEADVKTPSPSHLVVCPRCAHEFSTR